MATLERLRIRKPRPREVNGVVLNGISNSIDTKGIVETAAQQAERQQTESWIRALKVRLRLVLQSGQPAPNSESIVEDGTIPAQEIQAQEIPAQESGATNAEPNLAIADAQRQDATKWNVKLPVSSEKVYCIPKTKTFVALPMEVPVPPEAKELFEKQVKSLLLADLEEAKRYIESTTTGKRDPNNYIFEPLVLRMSGSATGGRNGTVTLSPTIWVRCSPAQQKRMRKALKKSCMKWAHNTEFGQVMVSAARLLSSDPPGWWEVPTGRGAAIDSLEEFTLHLEIEDPSIRHQETPLHGILCRATIMHGSVIFSQNLSRIGGLVTVNGTTLGLTSAHGIFGSMLDMLQSGSDIQLLRAYVPIEGQHGSSGEVASYPDDNDSDQDSSGESAHDYSCYAEFTLKPPDPVETNSTRWLEVHIGGIANFLGQKAILASENTDLSTIIFIKDVLKSDFALIDMAPALGLTTLPTVSAIRSIEKEYVVPAGPVELHIGGAATLDGLLLEGAASLEILGVPLPTQTVQLAEPLALGCSGTWVTREGVFCGMIIAGYANEPFAHMIPAAQLVADIQSSLSAGAKSEVTLFQGRLAEGGAAARRVAGPPAAVSDTRISISPAILGDQELTTDKYQKPGVSSQLIGFAQGDQREMAQTAESPRYSSPGPFASPPYLPYWLPVSHPGTRPLPHSTTTEQESSVLAAKPPEAFSGPVLENKNTMQPLSRPFLVFAALYAAFWATSSDRYIAAAATPRITVQFSSINDIAWYMSAYFATSFASQFHWNQAYNHYQKKTVFLSALVIFAAGLALSGGAPSTIPLIVGRSITGLGQNGVFMGTMYTMIPIVPLHRRPAFQGFLGLTFGAGSIAGPLLGGVFTTFVSWRWCFIINIPIVVIVFIIIGLYLPPTPQQSAAPSGTPKWTLQLLQLIETGFFLSSVICLILCLQFGSTGRYSWDDRRLIALYCMIAILLLGFAAVEFRQAASKKAILPWHIILHQRSIACSALYTLCMGGILTSTLCWLPIWFQTVRQTTAFLAALYTLPFVGGLIIASIFGGLLTQKIGYYTPVMFSAVLITAGSALMSTWKVDMSLGACIGYQILMGSGLGAGMQIPGLAAQTVLRIEDVSLGVRVMFTANALGSAVFLAVGQAIFASSLRTDLSPYIAAVVQAGGAADLAQSFPPVALPSVLDAFNGSLRNTLFVIVALSVLATLVAVPVEWKSIRKREVA